jgi:hypothetical protein
LQDTAGVQSETPDLLELVGIKQAQSVAEQADLVVAMADATEASRGVNVVREAFDLGCFWLPCLLTFVCLDILFCHWLADVFMT